MGGGLVRHFHLILTEKAHLAQGKSVANITRPNNTQNSSAILIYMQPNITIYSADWCAFCHAAKDYLDRKGIKYTEKNVEEKREYAEEAVAKSNQAGIPVLDINGEIIIGFDRPRIDAALAKATSNS